MKKWLEVQNLPKDLGVKVDMGKLKGFNGICNLTVVLTENEVYFKEMNIEFPTPWICDIDTNGYDLTDVGNIRLGNSESIAWRGRRNTSKKQSVGSSVPEPFMPNKELSEGYYP